MPDTYHRYVRAVWKQNIGDRHTTVSEFSEFVDLEVCNLQYCVDNHRRKLNEPKRSDVLGRMGTSSDVTGIGIHQIPPPEKTCSSFFEDSSPVASSRLRRICQIRSTDQIYPSSMEMEHRRQARHILNFQSFVGPCSVGVVKFYMNFFWSFDH